MTADRKRHRRRAATASGYTLVEVVVAMGASSLLVGGLASSILIANCALDPDDTAAADATRAATALSRVMQDARQALRFTERTARAITFTVPDRTGDSLAETIRYSWSGTPGDPLLCQINGAAPLTVAANVQTCSFSAVMRLLKAEDAMPPPNYVECEKVEEGRAATDAQSVSVNAPGSENGKLLIAAVAVDGAVAPTLTAPAGWTLLSRVNQGQVGMAVWWKIGGSEPGSYTFTWTGPEQAYAWVMKFKNAKISAPINTYGTAIGTSANPTCPSVSTSAHYVMLLRMGAFDNHSVTVDNAGMTGYTTITMDRSGTPLLGGSASGGAAHALQPRAGTSGTSNFSVGLLPQPYVTFTIALEPLPAS